MQKIQHNKWLRLVILLCLLVATFSLTLSLLLPRLLDLNSYKSQLTETLQKQLNRKVSLGNASFSWLLGPSFKFSDMSVYERDSVAECFSARTVSFRLALLPLLNKKIELRGIELEGVRATLLRNKQGKLNIEDLLQPATSAYDLQIKGIKIHNGSLYWRDQSTTGTTTYLNLTDINLNLDKPRRGKKSSFKLGATLEGSSPGGITASGTIKLPKTGELFTASDIDAKLNLNQIEYWRFWPYLERYIPFKSPGGTISLNLTAKGRWQNLQAKATVLVQNAEIVWPKVFHTSVAPKQAQLTVNLKWSPVLLDMTQLQLSLDGFSIKGAVRLSELNSKDPAISVKAVSESFNYLKVKSYIPFGIIADDAAYFIEHRIRGGVFKLNTGTLNGRFSQLAHFSVGDNASALYIEGTAEQASIQYGEKSPTFRNIKGNLEMKGKHFYLHGMSGSFGNAPFTLEGKITDYATEGISSTYPFTMTISPHPSEVAWLAGYAGAEQLRFQGNGTTMKLQGDGPTSDYRLSGEWLLSSASYDYPLLVKKPAGMANTLTFSAILNRDSTRFTSYSYQLPPLKLSGNGLLQYSGEVPQLAFALETNLFQLNKQLPVLTDWQQYQLHGEVQAQIAGTGDPRSIKSMQFSGAVKLADFSLKPHQKFEPVTVTTAQIRFRGNSLETSNMAIQYGSTPLNVKGKIASLKNPEAELFITSPKLNPTDFGLPNTEKVPTISRFSTNIALRPNLLTIRNISGNLPKTSFSAAGTVQTAGIPDVNLRIAATHLDLEEIIPLLAPSRSVDDHTKNKPTQFRMQTYLSAESGSYRNTDFNKLTASLKNEDGTLHLNNLKTTIMDGKLTLNGKLIRVEGQQPKWSLSLLLERANAGELLKTLGVGREVRGLTTVQGNLTASGDELATIKKSANGTLSLKVERGTLRRFNSLSKVISILNVSQLLSFSLPDMARDGMPFNHISATMAIKDGVLTTQDFFIDSNVMHVTTVGKIDIVHETLDMLIGVQPLQTVDRIISRVPVVGWILSGGDGSMISTYFEAKGSWENPNVTAIPVKTIATGTFDIFRRVFELPVRLFTDTGEVILGTQKIRPKAGQAAPLKEPHD